MIEYEYLCHAIEAWKEGRRPSMPPPGSGAYEAGDLGPPMEADGLVYEDDDGAPQPVPASGTQPILAGGSVEPAATESYDYGQGAGEYGASAAAFDPGTMTPDEADLDLEEVEIEDDAEAEEEDDFERDYDLEEIDDYAAFDFNNDLAGYFRAEVVIENAWEDKGARLATLQQYGVRDETHWYQVKATLVRYVQSDEAETRWGGLDAIMQLQEHVRTDASGAEMQGHAEGESGPSASADGVGALGGDVDGPPPLPMDRYVEIMVAQSAAATQGMDAGEVLAEFGISAAEWGQIDAWWGACIARRGMDNGQALLHQFNELQAHYQSEYGLAEPDPDAQN